MALYFRVFDGYPLVVAANRDEHYDRPSVPPEVLGSNPRILAGRDLRAGGTWLGVNEDGLLVAILNRRFQGEQNLAGNHRSRGLLCLDVLDSKTAAAGSALLNADEQATYQPFTLVLADPVEAWIAFNTQNRIQVARLSEGLHVFSSNTATHDERSEKKERAYTLFSSLSPTFNSKLNDTSSWPSIFARALSDHTAGNNSDDTICVHKEVSGTVSASVILLSQSERRFQSFFCVGAPCRNSFSGPQVLSLR